MGRGRSGAGKGGGAAAAPIKDFPEAFAPGKDFQAVGGVDHVTRTVSRMTQAEWDQFSMAMNNGVTMTDEQRIMGRRDFSLPPNSNGDYTVGYVRTNNSFAVNSVLYDPANDGKSINQMFPRKVDRDTVRSLDKVINKNVTQNDGAYTRFCGANAVQSTFGLTNQQMAMIKQARNMTPQQLKQLNAALAGTTSSSKSYTSTSANRSLNAFSDPTAKQSKGFYYERKISVPKGTKAYAPRRNAQESEVIFGRGMQTKLMGISISSDGHIVFHEMFDGYK